MVDDLEEALSGASFSNLSCAMLHPLLIAGQEVGEVNDGRSLVGWHDDNLNLKEFVLGIDM